MDSQQARLLNLFGNHLKQLGGVLSNLPTKQDGMEMLDAIFARMDLVLAADEGQHQEVVSNTHQGGSPEAQLRHSQAHLRHSGTQLRHSQAQLRHSETPPEVTTSDVERHTSNNNHVSMESDLQILPGSPSDADLVIPMHEPAKKSRVTSVTLSSASVVPTAVSMVSHGGASMCPKKSTGSSASDMWRASTIYDKQQRKFNFLFNKIDAEGRGYVSCRQLHIFLGQQCTIRHEQPPTLQTIIKIFEHAEKVMGIKQCPDLELKDDMDHFPDDMDFNFFYKLMRDDMRTQFGHKQYMILEHIRTVFADAAENEQAILKNSTTKMLGDRLQVDMHTRVSFQMSYSERVVATVILLNALVMAMNLDLEREWVGWQVMEVFFLVFFTAELLFKMWFLGIRDFCVGPDRTWNLFDFLVVSFAVIDFCISMVLLLQTGEAGERSGFALLRLVRMARLGRLVRLLRFRIFKELRLMVKGVFAGLRVLIWAIVLLFVVVFMIGMVLRQTVGDEIDLASSDLIVGHFLTLHWSMFTVFRCFTDGCVAHDGTPLQAHMAARYGAVFTIPYTLIMLFVIIGIFNLIMAIFVESVMGATKQRQKDEKKLENAVAAQKMNSLMELIQTKEAVQRTVQNGKLSSVKTTITRDILDEVLDDPKVDRMLDELEIVIHDRSALFEILDARGTGVLDVQDIVKGLLKLRGSDDRCTLVATLLSVQALQESTSKLEQQLLQNQALMVDNQHAMQRNQGLMVDNQLIMRHNQEIMTKNQEKMQTNQAHTHAQLRTLVTSQGGTLGLTSF